MTDRTRGLKDVLWFFTFFGLVAIVLRLWYGLGATTNLTDQVPWGLWKIMNMVAGVALATGGFTIGFLVYVLKLEKLRPMVKPAILIAVLGYGSSVFALLLDIGIPYRIWHAIVMWNEHSFLFEVAWCVMIYFTITMIELSPVLLERLHLTRFAHFLHRISFGVVVLGISLSCLHHSSLGSLFLVTPQRLHPLWFTPALPFLFITSAAGVGILVAVLVKIFHSWAYDPAAVFGERTQRSHTHVCVTAGTPATQGRDFPMVQRLATIAAGILAVYLVLKIGDLIYSGALPALLAMTWESYFYIGEVVLLAVVPLLLLLNPRTRRSPLGLGLAAASAAVGLVWNRLNVGIFGYFRDAGTVYVPSLTEWALSLGIIAAAALVFLYVCEYLPIFEEGWENRYERRGMFFPSFDRLSGVCNRSLASGLRRTSVIAVLTIPVAWAALSPQFTGVRQVAAAPVTPPLAVDQERTILNIDGNQRFLAVQFPHQVHQMLLGGEDSCSKCHHLSLPNDHSTACSRCHQDMKSPTRIFNHTAHWSNVTHQFGLTGMVPENTSCSICHDAGKPKQAASAMNCIDCHEQDMMPTHSSEDRHFLEWASSYQTAMHKTCIACHLKEAAEGSSPDLAECSTCHVEPALSEGMRDLTASVFD